MTEILYKELSYKVVGCAMEVHKELGPGFLESVYEAAMVVELEKQGIQFALQTQFPVIYKGVLVKHFIADMVI
ncbi:MAG TPA: GxxExxY protein, partial [Candidatus Marinimicrobia bacterium]|nr:GxxExxY protein [Candidatus Neomarinimicrobiota bacterium]